MTGLVSTSDGGKGREKARLVGERSERGETPSEAEKTNEKRTFLKALSSLF